MLHNSRGEGGIVLGSKVVWVQVEHADHKGHKHHDEDDHELEDVLDRATQRDLQWAEALVGRQNVGDTRETEHHSDSIQAFRDDLGVRGAPLVPGWRRENYNIALKWTKMTVCNTNRTLCQRTWKTWMDREEEEDKGGETSKQNRLSETKQKLWNQKNLKSVHI